MRKYLELWWYLTYASFQTFFISRVGAILFLTGKILRFVFFLSFIFILVSKTKALTGYTLWEVMLFYLTFNFIDATTQMLFREVYRFRQQVVSGNFDLILVKPVSPLFRVLFGGTDFLDFITLLPFLAMIGFAISKIPAVTSLGVLLYLFLLVNSLIIATFFHILVLALAIITTEIDHAIMIYRDLSGMGKFPIDIYGQPLRSLVTFVVPVGIMMTFPVKALIGSLNIYFLIYSLIFSLILYGLSLTFWQFALKRYTSASS